MDFGNQFLSEHQKCGFAAGLSRGLGDVIGCAAGESFNGDPGAALGKRTAHDYRHPVSPFPQLPQCDQSVHDRHLDIEQNQVGTIDCQAVEG
jgi:hypothetical protein